MWAKLDQPYRLATQLADCCAERIGAVVQLMAEDVGPTNITFQGITTKTEKTQQSRIIPALKEAIAEGMAKPNA